MKLSKITLACALAAGMAAPQIASADDAFEFHGYARAGFTYEADGVEAIGPSTAGGFDGNALGRLGNESNGGEFTFLKKFEGDNGTKWEVGFMIEDWGKDGDSYNNIGTKQAWAGGTNIWSSQPDAYVWAGKVFHGRLQTGLNDYFILINDAEGAGIKGLDLGFTKLEFGVTTQSSGLYALTSKFGDISLGPVKLDIYANYGFSDDTVTNEDAHQIVTVFNGWGHNFIYRNTENTENSIGWSRVGEDSSLTSHFFSFDGSQSFGDKVGLEYLATYSMMDKADDTADRTAITAIVRPTYQWNNIHSTWLEFGYATADFDSGVDMSAYKVTFSQNIAVGGVTWARPQIRLFVTMGEEDNDGEVTNPVIVGTMFEAWW